MKMRLQEERERKSGLIRIKQKHKNLGKKYNKKMDCLHQKIYKKIY